MVLEENSQDYKTVEAAFKKASPFQVIKIERIQNKQAFELYTIERDAMQKRYKSSFSGKERMLFHGTSLENVEKINAHGLNRSYSGKHNSSNLRRLYNINIDVDKSKP